MDHLENNSPDAKLLYTIGLVCSRIDRSACEKQTVTFLHPKGLFADYFADFVSAVMDPGWER